MPTVRPLLIRVAAVLAAVGAGAVLAGCGGGGSSALDGGGGATAPATAPPTTTTTVAIERRSLSVTAAPWSLAAPIEREALVTDGTSLYVAGGLDPNDVSSGAVVRIDPATGKSVGVGTLPLPVHDTMGVWRNGAVVVIGGGSPPLRAEVQSVTPSGPAKVIGTMPEVRADHVIATVGDTIYAFGGGDEASRLMGSIVASSDGGVTWKAAGQLAEAVRYPAVGTWDGLVYVIGGVGSTGGTDTTSIQRYDPKTGQTVVAGRLPRPMSHLTAVQFGPLAFLAGGYVDNKLGAQVLRLDLRTLTTTDAGVALPAPLGDSAAVVIGDTGYLVGGQGADKKPVTTVTLFRLG